MNSDTKTRLERELCTYLGITAAEVKHMGIGTPRAQIVPVPPVRTSFLEWARRVWTKARYRESLRLARWPQAKSIYACHAEEITKFSLYTAETNTFAETFSCLDAGLQKLLRGRWAPEASVHSDMDIEWMLPPVSRRRCFLSGFAIDDSEEMRTERESKGGDIQRR